MTENSSDLQYNIDQLNKVIFPDDEGNSLFAADESKEFESEELMFPRLDAESETESFNESIDSGTVEQEPNEIEPPVAQPASEEAPQPDFDQSQLSAEETPQAGSPESQNAAKETPLPDLPQSQLVSEEAPQADLEQPQLATEEAPQADSEQSQTDNAEPKPQIVVPEVATSDESPTVTPTIEETTIKDSETKSYGAHSYFSDIDDADDIFVPIKPATAYVTKQYKKPPRDNMRIGALAGIMAAIAIAIGAFVVFSVVKPFSQSDEAETPIQYETNIVHGLKVPSLPAIPEPKEESASHEEPSAHWDGGYMSFYYGAKEYYSGSSTPVVAKVTNYTEGSESVTYFSMDANTTTQQDIPAGDIGVRYIAPINSDGTTYASVNIAPTVTEKEAIAGIESASHITDPTAEDLDAIIAELTAAADTGQIGYYIVEWAQQIRDYSFYTYEEPQEQYYETPQTENVQEEYETVYVDEDGNVYTADQVDENGYVKEEYL